MSSHRHRPRRVPFHGSPGSRALRGQVPGPRPRCLLAADVAARDPSPPPTAALPPVMAAGTGAGTDVTPALVVPVSAGDDDIAFTNIAHDLSSPHSVASPPPQSVHLRPSPLGSAPLAAPSETTAEGDPILPTVPVADPAVPEVVAALPDGPLGSDPISWETEFDSETAASVAEAVITAVAPAADLPETVTPLERASAAAGMSRALVPFRPLAGSRYPEASQGVHVVGSSWTVGFMSASQGSVAAAPSSVGEAAVWMDARAQDSACLSWEAKQADVVRQLEDARREAESTPTARCEAEQARRERDSSMESLRHGWQALRDAETARDRAQEEAARTVLRVSELETTFSHQATAHT